jgi:hypothetical protein
VKEEGWHKGWPNHPLFSSSFFFFFSLPLLSAQLFFPPFSSSSLSPSPARIYTQLHLFFFLLLLSLPLLSAQLFFSHFSSSLSPSPICTPSSILFFFSSFFFFFSLSPSYLHPQPPQWPKGVVELPLMPPFFFHVCLFFFFLFNRGWSGHPLRPLGWLGHHQTGRFGGGPATLVA